MDLFTSLVYQPFLNLLIGFYYLLERIPSIQADMGIAVILFTIVIRVLLLPVSIASTRTKKERYDIEQTILQIQSDTKLSPEQAKIQTRKIFRSNRRVVISEAINFFIQLTIFIVLYRIFTTGLKGADLYLLYDFMPAINHPFNLNFIGLVDLTHPSLFLNLIQSLTILAVELISLADSPFPVTRNDIIRYLIILPIASFLIFMTLPAGKKLFIITTLIFSFLFTATNLLTRQFSIFFNRIEASQAELLKHQLSKPDTTLSPDPTHLS